MLDTNCLETDCITFSVEKHTEMVKLIKLCFLMQQSPLSTRQAAHNLQASFLGSSKEPENVLEKLSVSVNEQLLLATLWPITAKQTGEK